jgi:hypothetical protein
MRTSPLTRAAGGTIGDKSRSPRGERLMVPAIDLSVYAFRMSCALPAGALLLRVNRRNTGTFFVHGFDNAVVGSGTAVANALRS